MSYYEAYYTTIFYLFIYLFIYFFFGGGGVIKLLAKLQVCFYLFWYFAHKSSSLQCYASTDVLIFFLLYNYLSVKAEQYRSFNPYLSIYDHMLERVNCSNKALYPDAHSPLRGNCIFCHENAHL